MEDILTRLSSWRKICPDLTIRSTFIVDFLGKLRPLRLSLQFLTEAKLDRVGCFTYSPVAGAKANEYRDHIPEEISLARQSKLLLHQANISKNRVKKMEWKTSRGYHRRYRQRKRSFNRKRACRFPEIDGIVHIYPDQEKSLV